MGKRKFENEKENSAKKAKTNNTEEVDNEPNDEQNMEAEETTKEHCRNGYDVKYLRKELAAKQGQTMVLTQFLQVCLNPDSDADYLLEYLKRGGNSHEILRQLTTDSKKNLTLATPAFHLFHLIILKVQSSVPHMIAITEEACRYFLNNFMSTVEIMISENSGPRHRKIVLKLLTSMVTLNPDLGIEVLNQAPLTPKHLKHVVENDNYKEQDNVRTSFVLFITSFLVDGHLPLIKALLEKQGLLGLVIPGLVQDDAKSVLMFLSILQKNVIDNTFISKSLKLKTFSQQDLHNLFKLFTWKGPPDLNIETKKEVQPEITSLLSEILFTLFTNHKTGLYFIDNSFGTTDTFKNPNLYRALLSLKRPWQNETESNLILDIVQKCPDLHRAIMNVIEQSFEPQHSPIWEKTVEFTIKLLNKLKPEDISKKMSNLSIPQVVNLVRFVTLPVPLLKYIQTHLGKDRAISLYCVKVLVKMLQTLRRYMQILEMSDSSAHSELRNKLEYFIPKHLPLPGLIVKLIQDIIDLKEDEKVVASQDYKLPKINDTDALISLIDLLLLYNDIQPAYFETLEGNIDMNRLLEFSVTLTDDNISVLKFKVVSLWLTMDGSVISLKNKMFKELFLIMLDVYMSDDEKTWIEAKNTLRNFFKNTAIFEGDEDEIHLILYTLRMAKVSPPALIGDIVEYVLQNIQELTETVRNQLVNFEIADENSALSLEKLFDDLTENRNSQDSVFIENKVPSPFIVGCMQYLFLNKDKKKALKNFLSLYVANLLHSNYSPELTEVLIGDAKLEARSYVASWTGQPVALPETIAGTDQVLKNISSSLLENKNVTITDVFNFIKEVSDDEQDLSINNVALKLDPERYIDSSELLIWAKYLIFCTVRLTDMNQIHDEQIKKITEYTELILAIARHKHMIDVCRMIVLNLLKNPHVLKIYKAVDFSKGESSLLATKLILNIIQNHSDIINYLDNKHGVLKSYKQKNYNELVKAFVKINKRKNIETEHTMKVIAVVGMSVEDDLRIFNHIFAVDPVNCVKDDKEPTLVLELLRILIDKYSQTINMEMQAQILRKCIKLYTELLTNKQVTPNLNNLEETLAKYFENKPYQAKNVSDDLFKKFFEANVVRKTMSYLASIILKHNIKLCSTFKEQMLKPEILSQRELTLPLGNAIINHKQFLLENKDLIMKIYTEYKTNINKLLEKPHKAGQVYVANSSFVTKLILECMELQDCEKLFAKSHKFECVELSHLELYQTVFYKLCTSEMIKKDHLINYFLSMLHIINIALKEGKRAEVIHEVVKNMYTVVQLSKKVESLNVEKKETFKRVIESGVWQNFCKATLKDSLKVKTKLVDQGQAVGPQLLCLLTNLVKLFYDMDHEDIATLFDMVTSHSEFLNVMLSHHSSDIKSRLLEVLYTLILRSKSVMKTQQIPVYLSSYHASRSPCDRLILAILYHYESNGLPVNEFKPYVWGDSGANHYAVRKNRNSTLWGHPTPNHVLNLFDRDIMERTVRNFPVTQKLDYHYELPSNLNGLNIDSVHDILDNMSKDGVLRSVVSKDTEISVKNVVLRSKYSEAMEVMKGGDVISKSHVDSDEEIYDPVFVFPLLSHLLAPGSIASCFKMMRSGVLSLPVAALSSHCPMMRAAAYHVLHRFCLLLETETRHKNDKLFLTDYISTLRHSLSSAIDNPDAESGGHIADLKNPRIPTIDALYLARALTVSTAPSHPLYKPVNNFLIAKQLVDLTVVPDFLSLFHDSDIESAERRYWILDVIKDGVKTITDVNVVFKTMCVKMIMDYYSSVLCEKKSKEKILGVLSRLVSIPRAFEILVEGYGLISWVYSVGRLLERGERTLVKGVLNLLQNMIYSMKINALSRNVALKNNPRNTKTNDFSELKINKDIENEILVILFDLSRNLEVLDVEDIVDYLKTYRLLTRRTVKCLSRNEINQLVSKVGEICKNNETLNMLSKVLSNNDISILRSNVIISETNVCVKELTSIVQVYVN